MLICMFIGEPEPIWQQPGGFKGGGYGPESGSMSPCVCSRDPAG